MAPDAWHEVLPLHLGLGIAYPGAVLHLGFPGPSGVESVFADEATLYHLNLDFLQVAVHTAKRRPAVGPYLRLEALAAIATLFNQCLRY